MYQFELKITTSQNQWQCSKMVNQSNIRKRKGGKAGSCQLSSFPLFKGLFFLIILQSSFLPHPNTSFHDLLGIRQKHPPFFLFFQQTNSESRLGLCGFEPKKKKENPTMLSSQGISHVIPHLSLVPYFPRGPTGLWHVWIKYVLFLFVD